MYMYISGGVCVRARACVHVCFCVVCGFQRRIYIGQDRTGLYWSANQPLEQSYPSYPTHCKRQWWSRAPGRCGRGLWITVDCSTYLHIALGEWWTWFISQSLMISVIMSLKSLDDLDGLPVLLGQLEKIGKWKYYAQGHSRHSLHYPMSPWASAAS